MKYIAFYFFAHTGIIWQSQDKNTIEQGDYVNVILKTGATLSGYLASDLTNKNTKAITLLIKKDKLNGYMSLSKVYVEKIEKNENQRLDLSLIEQKRQNYLKQSKQRMDELVKLREEQELNQKLAKTNAKTDENDTEKKSPDDGLSDILNKFPESNGYGDDKYNEYKKYWIKTSGDPPYLDLRTNAPPPAKEIEFYDNYSLWKFAKSQKDSAPKEQDE